MQLLDFLLLDLRQVVGCGIRLDSPQSARGDGLADTGDDDLGLGLNADEAEVAVVVLLAPVMEAFALQVAGVRKWINDLLCGNAGDSIHTHLPCGVENQTDGWTQLSSFG